MFRILVGEVASRSIIWFKIVELPKIFAFEGRGRGGVKAQKFMRWDVHQLYDRIKSDGLIFLLFKLILAEIDLLC